MIKNRTGKTLLLTLAILMLFPLTSLAAGITTSGYNKSEDIFDVYLDLGGVSKFTITQDATGATWDYTPNGQNYTNLTCNGYFTYKFYGSGGSLIDSSRVRAYGIINENSACKVDSIQPPKDYTDLLEDILGKIPPAPNWDSVADKFRDSIAPRIKSDLQDVLGAAPSQPTAPSGSAPSKPSVPNVSSPDAPAPPPALSGVDDNGLAPPTGQEDPALGDAGFSSGDIKADAPVIEERDDPSGGFIINDPVSGLPSQEEFKQNIPAQPSNPAPPSPPPSSDFDTPPIPAGSGGDTGSTAPIPPGSGGNTGGSAPIPGGSGGDTGSTAPIPPGSGGDFGIPIPGESNEIAP